jgi:hypothetical protein
MAGIPVQEPTLFLLTNVPPAPGPARALLFSDLICEGFAIPQDPLPGVRIKRYTKDRRDRNITIGTILIDFKDEDSNQYQSRYRRSYTSDTIYDLYMNAKRAAAVDRQPDNWREYFKNPATNTKIRPETFIYAYVNELIFDIHFVPWSNSLAVVLPELPQPRVPTENVPNTTTTNQLLTAANQLPIPQPPPFAVSQDLINDGFPAAQDPLPGLTITEGAKNIYDKDIDIGTVLINFKDEGSEQYENWLSRFYTVSTMVNLLARAKRRAQAAGQPGMWREYFKNPETDNKIIPESFEYAYIMGLRPPSEAPPAPAPPQVPVAPPPLPPQVPVAPPPLPPQVPVAPPRLLPQMPPFTAARGHPFGPPGGAPPRLPGYTGYLQAMWQRPQIQQNPVGQYNPFNSPRFPHGGGKRRRRSTKKPARSIRRRRNTRRRR